MSPKWLQVFLSSAATRAIFDTIADKLTFSLYHLTWTETKNQEQNESLATRFDEELRDRQSQKKKHSWLQTEQTHYVYSTGV